MNYQRIGTIIGIVVGVFTIMGGAFGAQMYIENKYAKAEDVTEIKLVMELTNKRLEQKIITDRILSLEERKDKVELKENMDSDDRERIQEYDRDIRDLELELKTLDRTDKG